MVDNKAFVRNYNYQILADDNSIESLRSKQLLDALGDDFFGLVTKVDGSVCIDIQADKYLIKVLVSGADFKITTLNLDTRTSNKYSTYKTKNTIRGAYTFIHKYINKPRNIYEEK